jgi:hypothetical protein
LSCLFLAASLCPASPCLSMPRLFLHLLLPLFPVSLLSPLSYCRSIPLFELTHAFFPLRP